MFEFYATKSFLIMLKTMYVIENLSDITNLLILGQLDALFGCGRVNSGVVVWQALVSGLPIIYTVCDTCYHETHFY